MKTKLAEYELNHLRSDLAELESVHESLETHDNEVVARLASMLDCIIYDLTRLIETQETEL